MSKPLRLLIVEDSEDDVLMLVRHLRRNGFSPVYEMIETAESMKAALEKQEWDVVISDYSMPHFDALAALEVLKETGIDLPFIIVSGVIGEEVAVAAMKAGAHDYLMKDNLKRLVPAIERELQEAKERRRRRQAEQALHKALAEVKQLKNQLQAENVYLQAEIKEQHNFEEIIGASPAVQKVFQNIEKVASTDATVLITGGTGSGKELIARAIHNRSRRTGKVLVKVNCAALPSGLVESELFGHEKGAFTGAYAAKTGRFELADQGTIFLDEIGDLPLELQTKLLRVLQEGEFERVGGSKTLKVDVRVIAATNRDLESAVRNGDFREDLYYRLNVFPIHSPPLMERNEDIPLLVKHFCEKLKAKIGKNIEAIDQKVMDALLAYDWPGNVRELENTIERAMIITPGNRLKVGDWLPRRSLLKGQPSAQNASHITTLMENEREYITRVLEMTEWRVRGEKGAAKILDIHPSTLESRMKKLNITRPQ